MKKLVDKIKLAKSGNEAAMVSIIDQYSPLIGKYTRMLNNDEDCRSELILKLIALVKNEIDLDNLRCDNDGAVFNYIRFSLQHQYIMLSKTQCRIRDNETAYDQESFVDVVEDKLQYSYVDIGDGITMDMLKSVLTEREFKYIKLIVLDGWTAEAVAKKFGATKQAVNQCKKRGLKS